ncbi:MAG: DUF2975 domain-containing protein [Bacteroidales bacterium]|nr:DUF2975 domain-containing protein [Bacteroidales bacterium]
MKSNTNIKFLKAIKIGFDVAIVAMSLFLVFFICIVVFDISSIYTNSSVSTILAKVTPTENTISKDFIINSQIDNITVSSYVNSYEMVLDMKSSDFSQIPVIYKIIFLTALNLNLFFIIFVFYQASKILKSIIRGIKESKQVIQHYIFNKKNIRRFQFIAYGFMVMPIIELVIYLSDSHFLSKYFSINGFNLKPILDLSSISWDYIFIGLLFISLIEIIRRGIVIQEENDLTV